MSVRRWAAPRLSLFLGSPELRLLVSQYGAVRRRVRPVTASASPHGSPALTLLFVLCAFPALLIVGTFVLWPIGDGSAVARRDERMEGASGTTWSSVSLGSRPFRATYPAGAVARHQGPRVLGSAHLNGVQVVVGSNPTGPTTETLGTYGSAASYSSPFLHRIAICTHFAHIPVMARYHSRRSCLCASEL